MLLLLLLLLLALLMLCRLSTSQPAYLPRPCTEIAITMANRLTAHTMRRTNIVSHLLGTRTRAGARAVAIYFCRLCVYNRGSGVSQKHCDCGRGSRANERRFNETSSGSLYMCVLMCLCEWVCVSICARVWSVCIYSKNWLAALLPVISAFCVHFGCSERVVTVAHCT